MPVKDAEDRRVIDMEKIKWPDAASSSRKRGIFELSSNLSS